jgi:Xaa-Pro aminopeptidase
MMSRKQRLKTLLNELSLDAFYITHIPNIRYISGFSGSSANIIITKDTDYFLTDFRYKDQSAKEVSGFEIIINYDNVSEVRNIFSKAGIKNAAFEANHLIFEGFENLKKSLNGTGLKPLSNKIEELTVQKTEDEIARIKKAVEITDKTFERMLEFIKPGITELEVSAEITYTQKKLGAEKDAFDPIVASGLRSALPHGIASQKKIEKGDPVTLDFGCVYGGFCSDLTRTVFVGKPTEELRNLYDVVHTAQMMAVEKAKAGMSSKQLDSTARDYINEKGFGSYFGHGLGHGLGIEVHEMPGLNQRTEHILKKNSVVTIEPGIYIESVGGVRIEDDVLLDDNGCTVLNKASKEFTVL